MKRSTTFVQSIGKKNTLRVSSSQHSIYWGMPKTIQMTNSLKKILEGPSTLKDKLNNVLE